MSSHDEKHSALELSLDKGSSRRAESYRDYAKRRIAQRGGMRPMRSVAWISVGSSYVIAEIQHFCYAIRPDRSSG